MGLLIQVFSVVSVTGLNNFVFVYSVMSSYKLDRTAFKAQTVEEASDHATYYQKISWKERLRVSAYLNSIAFNYPEHSPPRMDKTRFAVRSRN